MTKQLYMNVPEIAELVNSGKTYQKKGVTLLRKPSRDEIGKELTTFVKGSSEEPLRMESAAVICEDSIISRNPNPIAILDGHEFFNEWVQSEADVAKNYGERCVSLVAEADGQFLPFKKCGTFKAIEITQEVLQLFGVISGNTLEFAVSWTDKPMVAKIGDWITSSGYSVSCTDFEGFEEV